MKNLFQITSSIYLNLKCLVIPAFLVLIINNCIKSQTITDTLEYNVSLSPHNLLLTNFDKQLNTYYISTGLQLNGKTNRFQYRLDERFNSTLVQANTNSIRDEQYFYLNGKYKLTGLLQPGLTLKSSILSDDRQLEINQATVNQAILFNEIEIVNNLFFTPYGGISDNRQVGENDKGPVYGFEGFTNNYTISDLNLNTSLKFENEDISPRKNTVRYFSLVAQNTFEPQVTNAFSTSLLKSRKDFYFPADSITSSSFDITNNIESRSESVFYIEDRLNYNGFLDLFELDISGRINWRTIDRDTRYRTIEDQSPAIFDTNIEELGLALETAMVYNTAHFNGGIRLNYIERDEKHITKRFEGANESFYEQRSEQESRKNNNSGRATISLFSNWQLSDKDKLTMSLFHSKLKYDTPSPSNDDDRDELLSIARVRYSHFLSPFFETYVNAEGTLSHVVYLFASRSANNNINRVLRFMTGGYYNGTKFSSLNNFEVSANYTVYDFEDVSSNLRSISFRQFTATDSTRWNITKIFQFVFTGYVKLTDQGDLNWDDFAERPTRYLEEIFVVPKIGLAFQTIFAAVGLRYFSLRTFNYDERVRVLDTEFLSIGPLVEIILGSPSLYLKLDGWYEFISQNDVPNIERANLIVKMNWNF